jgi:hypothetical protein
MTTTQPAGPASRRLTLLLIGHLGVAAGAVVVVVLLAQSTPTRPAEQLVSQRVLDGLGAGELFSGLAALGLAQVLSIRRLLAHRRALADDPWLGFHAPGFATGMERLEWTMALALYPIVIGLTGLVSTAPPAPLLALYFVLPCASPLLDQAHAGWAHRFLDGHGPRTLPLPPGGARLRRRQGGLPVLLIGLAGFAALLAAGCAAFVLDGGVAPPAGLFAAVAAGAAAVPALLLVGPARRVRDALRADGVDLPGLDSAARAMRRIGPWGALGAALLAAAVLTGSAGPRLGLAIALPLTVALGNLSVQLSLVLRIRLGVPLSNGFRWSKSSTNRTAQRW